MKTSWQKDDGDTTPDASFLRSIHMQVWSVQGAIAELVDNAFGIGRGHASEVWLSWNPRKRLLRVIDNGKGMTALRDLFKYGQTAGRIAGDPGEYGAGGTKALLWLGSVVRVSTLRIDENEDYESYYAGTEEIEWAEHWKAGGSYPYVPTDWAISTIANTPKELRLRYHGTMVELLLPKYRKLNEWSVRRELSFLYAPAIRSGLNIVWVTEGQSPIPLSDPSHILTNPVTIDFTIDVGEDHLGATGEIGIVEDLSLEDSRVSVAYGPRVITRTRDCFRLSDSSAAFSGIGVTGWIDLNDAWQGLYTTEKDALRSDSYDALMDAIFHKIKPLLESVKKAHRQLLFDSIAANLAPLFDGSLKVATILDDEPNPEGGIEIPGTGGPGPGPVPPPGPGPVPWPGPFPAPDKLKFNPGDGQQKGDANSASKLLIGEASDTVLEGRLASCDVDGDGDIVFAYVNKDHDVIKLALEEKPVNQMALASFVVHAVADAVFSNERVLCRWFGKRVASGLANAKSDAHRRANIVRYFMDRYRNVNLKRSA